MKTLYLGLDPKNYFCSGTLVHYPVIRTMQINGIEFQKAISLWPQFTHVVFTSQTAVKYWEGDLNGKICIAIGEATAEALRNRGAIPLIAPNATQEGVIELIESMELQNAFLFLPRSRLSRSALTDFLQRKQICFFALDLYDTLFQKLEPVPDLNEIDEIVFTSPSTVDGFVKIYGKLPSDKKLTGIGPITQKAISAI